MSPAEADRVEAPEAGRRRQEAAPYVEAVASYAEREPMRLHIPGHAGEFADEALLDLVGPRALRSDIPAGIPGIDVDSTDRPSALREALHLAAQAWGARRSWFLFNGASGGNHAICLALAQLGDRVVVQRNAHSSIIDGLILSGLSARFIAPELNSDLGIAHCLSPTDLDAALHAEPAAVGALVVSPTYYGALADVKGLADVAHHHGVPLVVDEAWGAHLPFSARLPSSALECGADLVLVSAHKCGGALTQSALLHLGHGEARLDEHVVDRAVILVESTSRSSLLTASLDAMRRRLATAGTALLERTLNQLEDLRHAIDGATGFRTLTDAIRAGASVHDIDPLRLVVDVRASGQHGQAIANRLATRSSLAFDMASEALLVMAFGPGPLPARIDSIPRFLEAVARDASEQQPGAARTPIPPFETPNSVMRPREAFLGAHEPVPLENAAGRICAETLAVYPPGVPDALPGEILSQTTLDYLQAVIQAGGIVRGASDRTLASVRVVRAS